jgi:hypothetical protein
MHVGVMKDSTLVVPEEVSSWYTFTLGKKFLGVYRTLKKSGLAKITRITSSLVEKELSA